MAKSKIVYLLSALLCLCYPICAQSYKFNLQYKAGPADNPLKGLVPYAVSDGYSRFPHSMEFRYLSLRDLLDGKENPDGSFDYSYTFEPLEKLLDMVAGRGHTAIFRIYLEYPNKDVAVPQFLIDSGVKIIKWEATNSDGVNLTPDYEDPKLRSAMTSFIAELGRRYDGDPRLAFITAGFLGKWGEWHNYPKGELFASKKVQQEILDAYSKAFNQTPVLLRYPAGEKHYNQANNSNAPFGYHDDSFGWATLETGKKSDSWFFMPAMKAAGPAAMNKWKKYPIGGEIRPELWERSFTEILHPKAQNFDECIEQTHVTWLMDTGLFGNRFPMDKARKDRAIKSVQKMGYDFHISQAIIDIKNDKMDVCLTVENRGVAPFYYNWTVEMVLLDKNQSVIGSFQQTDWDLRKIFPGEPVIWIKNDIIVDNNSEKQMTIAIKAYNSKQSNQIIEFANEYQNTTNKDYLIIGTINSSND